MKHQINESHIGPDATPNDAQRVAARLTALGYPCEYNPAQGASGAGASAVYGIAAEPFALFQSADGQAVIIERHDGPSPVIRAIDRTKFGAMVAAALEGEAYA